MKSMGEHSPAETRTVGAETEYAAFYAQKLATG